jgi:N6-adenosine-specific RNA methylase IME4
VWPEVFSNKSKSALIVVFSKVPVSSISTANLSLDFPALAALPIADLAADHCALFLWATDPLLLH